MLRVYACIAGQHDLRLVGLSVLICLFACYTAVNLLDRARAAEGGSRRLWLWAAAVVAGSGIWTTHFVAMLAFRPGFPVGYDIPLTVLSVAIAIALAQLGFSIGLRSAGWIGGLILGGAVSAMHYVGMAALRVPADLTWDAAYVVVSVIIGAVFGAAALAMALRRPDLRHRVAAGALMAAAICGMHFTAMTAVALVPDLLIPIPHAIMAPEWLAVAIAAVTILILALGLTGSIVDQRFAERNAREAERMRSYIVELEATHRNLERTTAELAAALEAASASNAAKSQFLAAMSHELRTPLNAIIGFSELLADQTLGPIGNVSYLDYAQCIKDSGGHLLGLIDDILDLAKLEGGKLGLSESEFDLADVIREAVVMVRHQAEAGGVQLSTSLSFGLPAVRADRRRVRQVLVNLVSNAVKFTPEKGRARVSAYRRGAEIAITVDDTGIGIAPDDIPTALTRFGQIDGRLARKFEGSGIGLPLSKQLVELHGGRLELESQPGVGTSVTIVFPPERIVKSDPSAPSQPARSQVA